MDRSKPSLFFTLLAAATLGGCAADLIPRPTSPDDPSNPDAAELPTPKPPASLSGEGAKASETAAPSAAPPAHHHHHGPSESRR